MPVKSLRFLNVGSRSANNRWLISPVQCRGFVNRGVESACLLITNPEALTVAATEVRRIRDRAIQSDAQVAPMTTAVRPPAADLVSEKAATFLVEYARKYRQTIAAAAVVLEEFAHALTTGADKYATAEADNIKTFS